MHSVVSPREKGVVIRVKRYILTLSGLPRAKVNDLLLGSDNSFAIVRAIEGESVMALLLSGNAHLGDEYTLAGEYPLYSADEYLFGRVIDTLGRTVDGKGAVSSPNIPLALEVEAPGIEVRLPIHDQLSTGVSAVDTLVPIAKGQRQLLFGPMRSGKTTFLTQTVLEQAYGGTVCIYTVIGKPINGLKKITDSLLNTQDSLPIITIAALSDEPPPLVWLAPSVTYLLAEAFQKQGKDVLVILDDLDAHAKYLREIALLEERLPSTESYPGDIFYQHAHLMERSGHFNKDHGGGSITSLPVIQTDVNNFSDLIPTNVMACTDGHLSFSEQLRAQGQYPSVLVSESVTRVGRQSQCTMQKQITLRVQKLLSEYSTQKEYETFSSDLSQQAHKILHDGSILEELMLQEPYEPYELSVQVIIFALLFVGFFEKENRQSVKKKKSAFVEKLHSDSRFDGVRKKVFDDNMTWEEFTEFLALQIPVLKKVYE